MEFLEDDRAVDADFEEVLILSDGDALIAINVGCGGGGGGGLLDFAASAEGSSISAASAIASSWSRGPDACHPLITPRPID